MNKKFNLLSIVFSCLFFSLFFLISKNSYSQVKLASENPGIQNQATDPILNQNQMTISESQAKDMERLLEMPTGQMNNKLYVEILAQIACYGADVNELDDVTADKIFKPYNITFEEWLAYHWQMISGKLDINEAQYTKIMESYVIKLEELKQNNCELVVETKKDESLSSKMNPKIWVEITARIKCLDRTLLSFTKDEIDTIFTPFAVTPVEYQDYSDNFIKNLDHVLEKRDDELTASDLKLISASSELKPRIEQLKASNCVLEDGTPISQEYDLSADELKQWKEAKCELFSCGNCLQPTKNHSWWNKYRCNNLCKNCPVSLPEIPIKEDCVGLCSTGSCPPHTDQIRGNCASQETCKPCGLFNLFKCCKDEPAVCCQTKPTEVCQGTCGLKECPAGSMAVGTKNCPNGKEKYKCYVFFKCSREVEGVCCVTY